MSQEPTISLTEDSLIGQTLPAEELIENEKVGIKGAGKVVVQIVNKNGRLYPENSRLHQKGKTLKIVRKLFSARSVRRISHQPQTS